MDSDLHSIYKNDQVCNPNNKICIGDRVWIGAYSQVGKNTNIHSNVILSSHSVACKEMQSGFIYAGNPSKPIKEFDKWI